MSDQGVDFVTENYFVIHVFDVVTACLIIDIFRLEYNIELHRCYMLMNIIYLSDRSQLLALPKYLVRNKS